MKNNHITNKIATEDLRAQVIQLAATDGRFSVEEIEDAERGIEIPDAVANQDLDIEIPELNSIELGRDFARTIAGRYLIDAQTGAAMYFTGKVWEEATRGVMESLVQDYLCEVAEKFVRKRTAEIEAEEANGKLRETARGDMMRRYNTLKGSRTIADVKGRGVAALEERVRWNHDPFVFNTDSGVWAKGRIECHRADDYASNLAAVTPCTEGRKPERYLSYVDEMLGGNEEKVKLLLDWMGYSLTGSTDEQKALFVYGASGCGKSTHFRLQRDILGSYAGDLDKRYLFARGEPHPTGLMKIKDVRCLLVDELPSNRVLNDDFFKVLASGEPMLARKCGGDEVTFDHCAKLMLNANVLPPSITHESNRRRTIALRCEPRKSEVDPRLLDALRDEAPQILRLWLEHMEEWRKNGLVIPDCVKEDTAEYFALHDPHTEFLNEAFEWVPSEDGQTVEGELADKWIETRKLFHMWVGFCQRENMQPGSQTRFTQAIRENCGVLKKATRIPHTDKVVQAFHGIKETDEADSLYSAGICKLGILPSDLPF